MTIVHIEGSELILSHRVDLFNVDQVLAWGIKIGIGSGCRGEINTLSKSDDLVQQEVTEVEMLEGSRFEECFKTQRNTLSDGVLDHGYVCHNLALYSLSPPCARSIVGLGFLIIVPEIQRACGSRGRLPASWSGRALRIGVDGRWGTAGRYRRPWQGRR